MARPSDDRPGELRRRGTRGSRANATTGRSLREGKKGHHWKGKRDITDKCTRLAGWPVLTNCRNGWMERLHGRPVIVSGCPWPSVLVGDRRSVPRLKSSDACSRCPGALAPRLPTWDSTAPKSGAHCDDRELRQRLPVAQWPQLWHRSGPTTMPLGLRAREIPPKPAGSGGPQPRVRVPSFGQSASVRLDARIEIHRAGRK
jgi:hypothetical protein